jgi:chemotaxis protein histidine kinase CheA
MGLASVADRVRELDGDIAIKSRKGHGTLFRISLPLSAVTPMTSGPVQAAVAGNVS